MHERPNLTLAVIVKNEAELLDGLLRHHQDLFDEAVVVDTGSLDDSRQVALEAGARVFDFPWQDDFAAARNHGLQQSKGRWILQLDCDERIDPDDFQKILNLKKQPAESCVSLTVHNYTDQSSRGHDWCDTETRHLRWCGGAPGFWHTQPIRLYPNSPKLRYSGVIHENLANDVKKLALPLMASSAVIHHTGLLSAEGRLRRTELYGRLLLKKVRQTPDDLAAITELASFLVGKNQLGVAERLLLKGLEQDQMPEKKLKTDLLMIEIQTRLGKTDKAVIRLEETIGNHPGNLLCWIQAVVLYQIIGRPEKANAYLMHGRRLFPDSSVLKQLDTGFQNKLAASSA